MLKRVLPSLLMFLVALVFATMFLLSGAPWFVLLFAMIFPVIAATMLVKALRGEVSRRQLGAVTFTHPAHIHVGATMPMSLHVSEPSVAGRLVTFTLSLRQRHGKSWTEAWSTRAEVPLARGMLQAEAKLKIPADMPVSAENLAIWRVSAVVAGHEHAVFGDEIQVAEAPAGLHRMDEMLSDSRLESLELGAGEAPPGARWDAVGGHWEMEENVKVLRVVGAFMLVFALFWLWQTSPLLPREAWRELDVTSLAVWGMVLFQLPFLLVGILLLGLGIALPFLRLRYRLKPDGITQEASVFGYVLRRAEAKSKEVVGLRAVAAINVADKLSVGIVTARGILSLPSTAGTANAPDLLPKHALWVASALKRRDLSFDSSPLVNARPLMAEKSANRPNVAKLIGRTMAVFAFVGIVLIAAGAFFGTRGGHAPDTPVPPTTKAR